MHYLIILMQVTGTFISRRLGKSRIINLNLGDLVITFTNHSISEKGTEKGLASYFPFVVHGNESSSHRCITAR